MHMKEDRLFRQSLVGLKHVSDALRSDAWVFIHIKASICFYDRG